MAWRVADSLQVLRGELNKAYPDRDRTSDGTIGDAAHASRTSDHNPFVIDENGIGVVRAYDIDEDLDGQQADTGRDAAAVVDHLHALAVAGDPRIRYTIYEGRIASEKQGWAWRPYTGVNAHKKHCHLSVSLEQIHYDSIAPWGIYPPPAPPTEEGFMSALTEDEQKDAYRILKALETDYLTKGKAVRQVILETQKGVEDLTSGKRPAKP